MTAVYLANVLAVFFVILLSVTAGFVVGRWSK